MRTEPDDFDTDDLDDDFDPYCRPSCEWGMAGWCSTGRHSRCYFNTPDGQAASRAGTYGLHDDGHRWVCQCVCHADQDLPDCPHPDHPAGNRRTLLGGNDAPIQPGSTDGVGVIRVE